ncbi:hypothetical protein [Pseudoclavibacter sp. 8L]|nr:hypothetical protein [Pseudoclavibacter sp. 8L]
MPNLPGYSTTHDLARAALAQAPPGARRSLEVVTSSAHEPVRR